MLNSFTVPEPQVVRAPPGPSFVNFKTWLAVANWSNQSASASAGGLTSTVTAVPQRVTWEMGPPGAIVVCNGPGERYDPSVPDEWQDTDCGYTYLRSSAGVGSNNAYTARATVTYRATWSATDGTGGVIGTVSRSTTFSVQVAEIQALNTNQRY